MRKLNTLAELAAYALSPDENEWVYANIKKWKRSPKDCEFWLIPESEVDELSEDDVYESEGGPLLPKALEHENLYPWMMQDSLSGVLNNLKMNYPENYDEDLFIKGINYYRDFDAYLESGVRG